MGREARLVIPGIPHHITQRGNRRDDLFLDDEDRTNFLEWLLNAAAKAALSIIAYCLMRNHLHIDAVPHTKESLEKAFRSLFTKYAGYLNAKYNWCGYVVQNRYYSSPMDDAHAWVAFGYIEENPMRAKMVITPEEYRWSSAYLRARGLHDPLIDTSNPWYKSAMSGRTSGSLLEASQVQNFKARLKEAHKRNFPIGELAFIETLEKQYGRRLRPNRSPLDK